jgi:hypothetical protein
MEDSLLAPAHHFVEITCPETGRPIVVARTFRDDPVGALFASNQIGRIQYEAAQAYQADHEAMAGALRGPSHGPGDVAGWRGSRPQPDRLRKARDRLARAHADLGPDASSLVRSILIDGATLAKTGVRSLQQALDKLAVVYGFSTGPTRH